MTRIVLGDWRILEYILILLGVFTLAEVISHHRLPKGLWMCMTIMSVACVLYASSDLLPYYLVGSTPGWDFRLYRAIALIAIVVGVVVRATVILYSVVRHMVGRGHEST